jgi:aspartyl-tRNA(Asn)/glutamyl-tRNA(Gln) amidotransferase subunit B
MPSYEAVIGLEVHVQLKTRTKMFCGCANRYGDAPNTNTCPVCLGLPGALPVPNAEAVEKTLLAGLMLGCDITPLSKFDRKNYFYPDMPKNYQLSQYDLPFCRGGGVTLGKYAFPKEAQDPPGASAQTSIRLNRIHLEEDVAKSTHHSAHSSIDFNRAGTPLMEIVTEADLRTADQAYAFLKSLQQILVYGDVSDADMEKGQMRCDVNISVRPAGRAAFGTKCEIKNMNSISGVRRALQHEIARQIDAVSSGGTITQETRRWNDLRGETTVMRTKEDAHDYRYFPCPDLLPVRTDSGLLDAARRRLPELPRAKKQRFQSDLGLSDYQAEILASDRRLADYFERAAASTPARTAVANFLINDFLASEPDLADLRLPPEHFGTLASLVDSGQINTKQAKDVLAELFATGNDPAAIVREKGLAQMSDTAQLERLCDEAIAANPRSIEDYRKGKAAAINALKGRVMKETRGQANPRIVDDILLRKLGPPGTA